MNPTQYPKLVTSGSQGASGKCVRRIARANSEKLIERPAATPDHHNEVAGRSAETEDAHQVWEEYTQERIQAGAEFDETEHGPFNLNL